MQVILPERRQKKRYLTLKSAGIAGIALVVAFLVLTAWSAFRPNSNANLFRPREQPSDSTTTRRDPIVINEGPTDDHAGTNPVLLDPAAQDQLRPASAPPAAPAASNTAEQVNFEHRTSQLGKGKRITISGGSEGVQVHAEPKPAPAVSTQPPQ